MLDANVAEVLRRIRPSDRVLDVGGWARCFNRADWVIDKMPFATRGVRYDEALGLTAQGGPLERFSAETWVERDLCDREPWPFPDRFFDYCTCSHTLEDIRDPIWVCAEMARVAQAGYIEVPSMSFELTRGREEGVPVGLSHHIWVVERREDALWFHPKSHAVHGDRRLSLPPEFGAHLPPEDQVTCLFWEGEIQAREGWLHRDVLRTWVASHGPFIENEVSTSESIQNMQHKLLDAMQAVDSLRGQLWEARAELEWERKQHDDTRAMSREARALLDAERSQGSNPTPTLSRPGFGQRTRRWLGTG